jgi:hypothetical protein
VPFLRVLRDKRGYETTYLMHWFREGNKQKSRILYVFRTPPGVKVGREPIDPQVVREIEAQHPDIEFDWRALRENQQVIDTAPEPRRPRGPRANRPEPVEPAKRPREEEPERAAAAPTSEEAQPRPRGDSDPAPTPSLPRLVIPAAIEGSTREDQFVFLLNSYLQLRERVPHRTHDPVRREALMALVERLNPEAWVGEEQVVAGLQHAAEALERLSRIFSKRRRKRRAKAAGIAGPPADLSAAPLEAADAVESSAEPFADDASDVDESTRLNRSDDGQATSEEADPTGRPESDPDSAGDA